MSVSSACVIFKVSVFSHPLYDAYTITVVKPRTGSFLVSIQWFSFPFSTLTVIIVDSPLVLSLAAEIKDNCNLDGNVMQPPLRFFQPSIQRFSFEIKLITLRAGGYSQKN